MNHIENNASVSIKPYVIRYGWIFAALTLGLALLASLLDYLFEFDMPSTGINIAATAGATSMVANKFVSQQKRGFTPAERKSMTWASLGVSWLVSLIYSLIIALVLYVIVGDDLVGAMIAQATGSQMLIVAGAMLVATIIGWLVLYFFYGSFSKSAVRALEKMKTTDKVA